MFVLLLLVLLFPGAALADTLRLGGMVRCPYICDADVERPGFMLEVARHVFGQAGYQVEYHSLPWSRALKHVRTGHLDGIAGVLRRNAPDLVYPKQAQAFSQYVMFVPETSNWQYTGLVSLWQERIGITQDVSYGSMDSYIHRYRDTERIQSVGGISTVAQSLMTLARGRISLFIEDRAVVRDYLSQAEPERHLKEAGQLHGENIYIAFSPSNPKAEEYAQVLTEGIDRLRASGGLARILAAYNQPDWLF
ncbi:MAG: transporter substrate-binding domain-containing protein [Motiliproteus sp.]